eukprot:GDKJ01031986.1.p1 GENE.GDKJ01031986.1~~GDKJ01031986.1.p1  ORF type:complete len:422 (-),score=92.12 GDKJ01031986.1:799-2022(-)
MNQKISAGVDCWTSAFKVSDDLKEKLVNACRDISSFDLMDYAYLAFKERHFVNVFIDWLSEVSLRDQDPTYQIIPRHWNYKMQLLNNRKKFPCEITSEHLPDYAALYLKGNVTSGTDLKDIPQINDSLDVLQLASDKPSVYFKKNGEMKILCGSKSISSENSTVNLSNLTQHISREISPKLSFFESPSTAPSSAKSMVSDDPSTSSPLCLPLSATLDSISSTRISISSFDEKQMLSQKRRNFSKKKDTLLMKDSCMDQKEEVASTAQSAVAASESMFKFSGLTSAHFLLPTVKPLSQFSYKRGNSVVANIQPEALCDAETCHKKNVDDLAELTPVPSSSADDLREKDVFSVKRPRCQRKSVNSAENILSSEVVSSKNSSNAPCCFESCLKSKKPQNELQRPVEVPIL